MFWRAKKAALRPNLLVARREGPYEQRSTAHSRLSAMHARMRAVTLGQVDLRPALEQDAGAAVVAARARHHERRPARSAAMSSKGQGLRYWLRRPRRGDGAVIKSRGLWETEFLVTGGGRWEEKTKIATVALYPHLLTRLA